MEYSGSEELASLAADKAALNAWVASHQVVDAFKTFPSELTAEQLLALLRPLSPLV